MTFLLRTPARRIALAVALSAVVHALLLWLPQVSPPRFEPPPLPLLSAKLIAIPKQAKQPPKPRHTAPPKAPPKKSRQHTPPPVTQTVSEPAPSIPTKPETSAAVPQALAIDGTASEVEKPDVPPLPKQAKLVFAAYRGSDHLYVGEMRHELKTGDGHYSIRAVTRTVGLARLFKSYDLTQTSSGLLTKNGDLQPERFSEERIDERGTQQFSSEFDWTAHQATFSNGTTSMLPERSQDFLSFQYQLSQTLLDRGAVPVEISNGKKLEKYHLEVIGQEDIITPMGKQPALHLSKLHAPGEEGLDIWLALNYRLLPIKFQQIDRAGKISGEIVIKEIRVSDE